MIFTRYVISRYLLIFALIVVCALSQAFAEDAYQYEKFRNLINRQALQEAIWFADKVKDFDTSIKLQDELEGILSSNKYQYESELSGITMPWVVRFEGSRVKGVIKADQWSFFNPYSWIFGTSSGLGNSFAEVATSRLDRIFKLNLVPMTVLHENCGFNSAIQYYFKNSVPVFEWKFKNENLGLDKAAELENSVKLAFLDYIINNLDRHDGNILISPNDQLVIAIDHGLAFTSIVDKGQEWDLRHCRFVNGTPGVDEILSVKLLPIEVQNLIRESSNDDIYRVLNGLKRIDIKLLVDRVEKVRNCLNN